MASITTERNGSRRILFFGPDGKRESVRLGKATRKQAESIRARIETILADRAVGRAHDPEILSWLQELDTKVYRRMERAGLVKPRQKNSAQLKPFLEEFLKSLVIKETTRITYAQVNRCLLEYFGAEKCLREIQPSDGDKWRQWLKQEQHLAEATIARRVKTARQIFRRALKWKLVDENPFAEVFVGSQKNKDRMHFVSQADAQKVLEACPDAQWRLIFALSRYGGLRCPSEHLALQWSDVDWEHNRIRVPSSKTEHIPGGECRFIPIFPELRPYLLEAFEEAEPGTKYVITRYRDRTINLRKRLMQIIHNAGLAAWPKPFHNLRSSRQTELAEKYPIHVVCAWLGNSEAIAQGHYLQVTDAHFSQGAQGIASHGKEALAAAPVAGDSKAAEVATAWTELPPVLQQAVLAIIQNAGQKASA